mmetsp:Transcript_21494/g.50561  ORF Transcript_21494/g.50561 Transcript_21494/m.50561 type:complete len:160 (+) Transcript_21494:43-522(+)
MRLATTQGAENVPSPTAANRTTSISPLHRPEALTSSRVDIHQEITIVQVTDASQARSYRIAPATNVRFSPPAKHSSSATPTAATKWPVAPFTALGSVPSFAASTATAASSAFTSALTTHGGTATFTTTAPALAPAPEGATSAPAAVAGASALPRALLDA